MPTFKPGQLEPVATKTFRPDQLEVIADEAAPDDAPVVNEQRVGDPERTILNNLGLGGESQVKWLQQRGYEAGLDEEGVKVRRKGEKDWGRIEPQGFLAGKGLLGKGKELFRDLTQDAGDDYASGWGTVKGAALGTAAGTAAGTAVPVVGNVAGGIAGGIAGAGIGAATVEAARRLAGKAAGFEETGGELASGVGEQGLYGGVAQGAGLLLGAGLKKAKGLFKGAAKEGVEEAPGLLARVGEKLQRPEKYHEADVAYRKAISGKHQTRDRSNDANRLFDDVEAPKRESARQSGANLRAAEASPEHMALKESDRLARAAEAEAGVGLDASARRQAALQAELKAARTSQDEALRAGGPHTEADRVAGAELKAAAAEKKAAENESYAQLREKYASASKEVDAAVIAGEEKAKVILGENWADTVKISAGEKVKTRFTPASVADIVASPAMLRADVLAKHPALAHLGNRHISPNYAPMHADSSMTASRFLNANDMESRARRILDDIKNVGVEEFQEKWTNYIRDVARYFLNHPELGRGLDLSSPEVKNLAKAALGKVTTETAGSVMKTFQTRVTGKWATPRLSAAIERYSLAQEAKLATAAQKAGAPEATKLAAARQATLGKRIELGKGNEAHEGLKQAKAAATGARGKAESAYLNSPQAKSLADLKRLDEESKAALEATRAGPEAKAARDARASDKQAKGVQDKAMAARSSIYPDRPHRTVIRANANRIINAGMVAGVGHGIMPGFGLALGLATPAIEAGGRKAGAAIGRLLVRLGTPGTVESAPVAVRPLLGTIQKVLKTHGPDVAKAATYLAMKESEPLREMLSGEETQP